MNIGIVGSRRRNGIADYLLVREVFTSLYREDDDDKIVSGGCPKGADHFAEVLAAALHVPIIIYPADWKKYGKAAGFIRNGDIAQASDVLIACVAPDRTGGTEDTIRKYLGMGKNGLIVV